MPTQANIVKTTNAINQFTATPPNKIFVFCQKPALPNEPFRLSAALSPFIWQKPPIGNQFKEIIKPSPGASFHSVFFRRRHLPLTLRQAIARGGKQIPNSSTSTPLRRAIIKCPNSCPVTSSINIKRPTIIPKIIPITIYNNTPKSLF